MYERPLTPEKAGLDPQRLPTHVAIIMDGNGRWASSQGKNRLEGHYQGYHALKETVYACDDLGIQYLTVYAFSSENWRRSQDEVGGLMTLMLYAMQAEIEELIENKIRVRVSGRMSDLPEDLRTEFMAAAERTRDFTGLTFNIASTTAGAVKSWTRLELWPTRCSAERSRPNPSTKTPSPPISTLQAFRTPIC